MCLAVPMRIVAREGDVGECELGGVRRKVDLRMVPAARVGDYALIHAGFAISVLDEGAAAETLRLFEEMARKGAGG